MNFRTDLPSRHVHCSDHSGEGRVQWQGESVGSPGSPSDTGQAGPSTPAVSPIPAHRLLPAEAHTSLGPGRRTVWPLILIECQLCFGHKINLECTGETSGEAKEEWPSLIRGELAVGESEQQEIRDCQEEGGLPGWLARVLGAFASASLP